MNDTLQVAIVLFPHCTALDAVGPYEVLSRLPGAEVRMVGERTGPVRTDTGMLGLHVDATYAGLLTGRRAATHWLAYDDLAAFGAIPTTERVVFDGKYVTAAGVSAGIDMALTLAARVAGEEMAQAIQLGIEYDPCPPYDAGSPAKAPRAAVEMVSAVRELIV
jgi:putative intracellular protease/amidase